MEPKSLSQLEELEKKIRAKLQSDEPIDTNYWEELLKSLLVWKAKAKLTVLSVYGIRLEAMRALCRPQTQCQTVFVIAIGATRTHRLVY
jgi:hypothetical protein